MEYGTSANMPLAFCRQCAAIADCPNDVIAYLVDQDLGKFASVFRKEGCDDMEILRELEDEDLRDLGLGVGHIRRFRRGIPEPESNSTLL